MKLKRFASELDDIANFLQREGNNHHGPGNRYSQLDYMDDIPAALQSWEAHKDDKRINVGSCPSSGKLAYAKLMENHVLSKYPRFGKEWYVFKAAKKLEGSLQEKRNIR